MDPLYYFTLVRIIQLEWIQLNLIGLPLPLSWRTRVIFRSLIVPTKDLRPVMQTRMHGQFVNSLIKDLNSLLLKVIVKILVCTVSRREVEQYWGGERVRGEKGKGDKMGFPKFVFGFVFPFEFLFILDRWTCWLSHCGHWHRIDCYPRLVTTLSYISCHHFKSPSLWCSTSGYCSQWLTTSIGMVRLSLSKVYPPTPSPSHAFSLPLSVFSVMDSDEILLPFFPSLIPITLLIIHKQEWEFENHV